MRLASQSFNGEQRYCLSFKSRSKNSSHLLTSRSGRFFQLPTFPTSRVIDHSDLFDLASSTLSSPNPVSETEVRRAVSTLYYSLFHQLSLAAVAPLSHGGIALAARVGRTLEHRTMLKVCEQFAGWAGKKKQQGMLETLLPEKIDERLIKIADTFVRLQEARLRADYDLTSNFKRQDALTLLEAASRARLNLPEISGENATTVFLTALLFYDRWNRCG